MGVRFIYETVTPPPVEAERVSPEDLRNDVAALPEEWAAKLYDAIVALDAEGMLALIEAVRPQKPRLSDTLAQWVHAFEYERLMALVAAE